MSPANDLPELADRCYDGDALVAAMGELIERLRADRSQRLNTSLSSRELRALLDEQPGETLQERWAAFEWRVWPQWLSGRGRAPHHRWSLGVCALVISQAARPSWPFLECTYTRAWLRRLPLDAPLAIAEAQLTDALRAVSWTSQALREKALKTGLRIMLVGGYIALDESTDEDLRAVPVAVSSGSDVLDAALCSLGVLKRTPMRGAARRLRNHRLTPAELVSGSRVPERFRAVHVLYLRDLPAADLRCLCHDTPQAQLARTFLVLHR